MDKNICACGDAGPHVCQLPMTLPPPKESQKIPALDKPAEGLARVVKNWKAPDGSTYDLVLIVGDTMLCTENEHWGDFLKEDAANINKAHEFIVKPLREKAEKLEARVRDLELPISDALIWRQACNDAEKDRDAWKESAQEEANARANLQAMLKTGLEDADRLAGLLGRVILPLQNNPRNEAILDAGDMVNDSFEEINEALAAHLALKGKT